MSHTLLKESFEIEGTAYFIVPGTGDLLIANGTNKRRYRNAIGSFKVEIV
ncbi:hypothetical protein [Aquimarina algiphila]|nr:hypothetical protein [Aquimarina algiphila]